MPNRVWSSVVESCPRVGSQALSASQETGLFSLDPKYHDQIKSLLRQVARGDRSMQRRFVGAMTAPILKIIPYVQLYDRFFVTNSYEDGEDVLHPTETVISVVYESHQQAEVFFNQPNFLFTRPSFVTFNHGLRIPWNLLSTAGWNLLERNMNQLTWELARKRDAKAKAVIDAAMPTSHKLTHTGGTSKATVDSVIKRSNEIGFPVSQAVINPSRLMEMQDWAWAMPNIPESVSQQLVDNFFYANYGGIKWFVNPNAEVDRIYFGGRPEEIGWHDEKGESRVDTDSDITKGDDLWAMRDKLHAWTAENALTFWQIDIV